MGNGLESSGLMDQLGLGGSGSRLAAGMDKGRRRRLCSSASGIQEMRAERSAVREPAQDLV